MLCNKCGKKEATIRIYYEVNGYTVHRDFCDECAVKRCSLCGTSYDDIAKSGKCGCPECYKEFHQNLIPRIQKTHGNIKHIGKTPAVVFKPLQSDINNLRDELKLLIEQENYEQAAIVRDKIKALEAALQ